MGRTPPISAVETSQFQRRAAELLSDSERMELISYVASNPEAGDIMPGTGKDNLSQAQRNEMKRLVPLLIAGYSRRAS